MTRSRSYRQYCAVAKSLDLIGGRWTLLIVRELLFGPRRFKSLLESLPGIGTNLLSDRLRMLADEGLAVRRVLLEPPGATEYALTPLGRGLEDVLLAISRWGRQLLQGREPDESFRLRWFMLGMRSSFRPEATRGVEESYEFRIGDSVVHAQVRDGVLGTQDGAAEDPALVLKSQPDPFLDLALGRRAPEESIRSGEVEVEGEPGALARCLRAFAPAE